MKRADDLNVEEPSIPAGFTLLPVSMPPMLPSLVGHNGISRFFCLYYLGSRANWDTGWQSSTCSYYAGYEPLINHPVLAIGLLDKDLGSDDGPPVHALLFDRQTAVIYVGGWTEVYEFLRRHNPQPPTPTPEELQHLSQTSLGELREIGLFEFLLGPPEDKKQLCAEMIAWLDEQITAELLKQYTDAADRGDLNALHILMRFTQRVRSDNKA